MDSTLSTTDLTSDTSSQAKTDGATHDPSPLTTTDLPTPPELLRHLFKVQELRAAEYGCFQRGFQTYLHSKDQAAYNELCAKVTQVFSSLSQEVKRLESGLREHSIAAGEPACSADLIRSLQEHEKTKLQLVLKAAHAAQQWAWQLNEDAKDTFPSSHTTANGTEPPPAPPAGGPEPESKFTPQGWGGRQVCGCTNPGCEDGSQEPAPEPTEQEFASAIAEATQGIQAAVVGVNEILEELRYEVEEE
ncbi:hypothetical protein CYMTET_52006 [Cymbomonas tetramitiformis]|uniref:Uncharacterized protein n=1 Tax=Cymbomonas tetramitiformis TaxID=36881 RepID=A0AAE0BLA7_9CHLO|nr:hypothetical protein CYMTET_52006 [Cymbomonas tetramitiformis]